MAFELWKGNEAIAEAAVRAGCRFFFGYPITPQNEVPEYMARRLPGGRRLLLTVRVGACRHQYGLRARPARAPGS